MIRFLVFAIAFVAPASAQISGVYSVGDESDYSTLSEAVADLVSQGATGDVVFELAEGVYDDRPTISAFGGAGEAAWLTIRPAAEAVAVLGAGLEIEEAAFVTIEGLTVQGDVMLRGRLQEVELRDVEVERGGVQVTDAQGSGLAISSCNLAGALVVTGVPEVSARLARLVVTGNIVEEAARITRVGGAGLHIAQNTIRARSDTALVVAEVEGGGEIAQNRIEGDGAGLSLASVGDVSVTNNVVVGRRQALVVDQAARIELVHNTVQQAGIEEEAAAIVLRGVDVSEVWNNVLSSESGSAFVLAGASDVDAGWNALFAGGDLGRVDGDPVSAPSALGASSFVSDPLFVRGGPEAFTPQASALDGTAAPVLVSADIDGRARSSQTPVDLGAIAFEQRPLAGGEYTVGPSPTADFTSLRRAVAVLTERGLAGGVTMEVEPGTYDERVRIGRIEGASAAAPVRFQAMAGGEVVLAPTASGPEENYVFFLDGASHVTVSGFVIEPGGATYETGILIGGGGDEILVVGNDVRADGSSVGILFDRSSSAPEETGRIVVKSNRVIGHQYGIRFLDAGVEQYQPKQVSVRSNVVESVANALYVRSATVVHVSDNDVRSAEGSGLFLKLIDLLSVQRNEARSDTRSGLYVSEVRSMRANRNVSVGGEYGTRIEDRFGASVELDLRNSILQGARAAVYVDNTAHLDILHSTLLVVDPADGARVVSCQRCTDVSVAGSILFTDVASVEIIGGSPGVDGDWNAVYAPALGAAPPALGGSSFVALPGFVDVAGGDYTPTNLLLDATAAPAIGGEDLNGTDRAGRTPVDLGAIAFGAATASEELHPEPGRVELAPNPTAGAVVVRFDLVEATDVAIEVYDRVGRRVAALSEGAFGAGVHAVPLDTRPFAPGLYVVRLRAGGSVWTRPMTVVR